MDSNHRPSGYEPDTLSAAPWCSLDSGGIRTHEVYTTELKSAPFDRSGTLSL